MRDLASDYCLIRSFTFLGFTRIGFVTMLILSGVALLGKHSEFLGMVLCLRIDVKGGMFDF